MKKKLIYIIISILFLAIITLLIFKFVQKEGVLPNDNLLKNEGNQAVQETILQEPNQDRLAQAEEAIRSFMSSPSLSFRYISTDKNPTNLTIGKTTIINGGAIRIDTPAEWNRPIYRIQQKEYIDDLCEVYEYEVSAKTNQVIEVHLRYPEEIQNLPAKATQCESYGSTEIPLKPKAEIEKVAMDYLKRNVPKFEQIKSQLIYIPSKKGTDNPAFNEWKWENTSYKLPEGLASDPYPYPTIRIIISSGGKLISYFNSSDIFASDLTDVKWLSYNNTAFGFTFNYPDKVIPNQYWTVQEDINKFLSPNNVLAKDGILYIRSIDTSFDSVEAKWQKNKQEFGGKTLDPSWRMVIKNIDNEQMLGDFVKERYGSSCKFRKVATVFPDTFNIIIESDGKSLDTSQCPVNYDYYIKYSPINKVAVSWNTSQECQLGLNFNNCFDKQIAESFHYINREPLIYSSGESVVLKTTKAFDYSAEQLKSMADECGTKYNTGYFDKLVTKFSSSTELVYNFKYQGASQSPDTFIVTLIPNKAGYTSLDQFKKDFDMCSVAGNAYPVKLNGDWLLFVSSCGSGYSDDSGKPIGCDEVRKIVEPSLRLN